MKLRDYQEKLIQLVRQEFAKGHRKIIAWLATGGGKCYCPNAEVIMFDGSIKKVKNIIVGDKLMGPDSKPRTVLATTNGFGQLYKVKPVKGDSHIFNEDHIFTLRASFTKTKYSQGELYDISLKDYVDSTKDTKRQLKWARSEGIDFPEKEVFDPYLVGVYLGDGSRHCQSITNGDIEVQTYLEKICKSVYQNRKSCKKYRFNKEIKEKLKKCLTNGIEEKFIPEEYKINSRENRLKILAGLIDTDGYMHNNYWEITTKFPKLHDDILYLCRSLGFAAYSTIKKVKLKTWTESREYFRITISGDLTEVPIKVERKKTKSREQIKNVLNTGFKLEKIEKGEYAGFELDGDGRHLMSDFSITHNSAITIQLIKNLRENNKSVIFVVRRRQLVVETARKFEKMGIKCGIIMGNMKGFDTSLPVQVCSIDTVRPSAKDGIIELKDKHKFLLDFDSIVVDECLHKDTYVLTENKRAWKIERFEREPKKDWPKVWTYNEKNGKKELKKVVRVIPRNKNNIWIISCTKTKIKCTDNHRFFTQRGWVRADNLTLNDGIFFTKKSLKENISCDFSRVKNIQINKEIEKTYDLEIEDNHNFFVNHSLNNNYFLLAHNCHDTTAPSYRNLFSLFKQETIFIGVTATPFPVGNKVHDFWETCVKSIEIKDLIQMGYLVKPRMFVPVQQDLSGIKTTGGDYNNKQLGEKMSKLNIIGDVIDNYKKYGENKSAICFAVNKQHSKILCEKFNANDIPAVHCDESTKQVDRDKAINDLKSGKVKVLCNVDIYSTGCDIPEAEIGILARPTRSETLFIQQCLDMETEILTKSGFKKYDEIKESDLIGTMNICDNKMEWKPYKNKFKRLVSNDEFMCGIKSQHLDIRITNNHDMIINSNNQNKNKYFKHSAEQAMKRKGVFRIPVSCEIGLPENKNLSDFEILFIGLFLSDGCINKRTNCLQIGQSEKYMGRCNEIENIIKNCNFKYGKCSIKRTGEFSHCSNSLVFSISKGMPRGCNEDNKTGWNRLSPWLNKKFPLEVFSKLSKRQVLILLEGINIGDGKKGDHKDGKRITKTIAMGNNKKFVDNLQHLCVINGIRANFSRYKSRNGTWLYNLMVKNVKSSSIPGLNTKDGCFLNKNYYKRSRMEVFKKNNKEEVWCLSNENGTLITRRNGKVSILGNCGRLLRPYRKCGRCKKQYDNSPSCPHCGYTEPEYIKEYAVLIDHGNNIQQHGTPLDIREAALTKEDLEKKKKKTKLEEKEPQVKAVKCKACFLIYDPIFDKCPSCGHVNEQKKIVHKKGELVELGDVEPEPIELKRMRGKLATLQKKQRLNGYKENYPYFKMYEHYGDKIYKYPELKIPTWIKRYAGKKKQEQEEANKILERLEENAR